MRTEADLRQAIAERADQAPSVLRLPIPTPTRGRPARSTGLAIAAAAAVVAAVAAVPVIVDQYHRPAAAPSPKTPTHPSGQPGGRATPSAPPAPLLTHARSWVTYRGTGVVETSDSVEAQYIDLAVAPVATPGQPYAVREVTAFAPGLFSPALIEHAKPITVNGVPGYFGTVFPWRSDSLNHVTHPKAHLPGTKYPAAVPAVLWRIGADQWAAVMSTRPSENSAVALTALAGKVHVNSAPVRSPLRIGYLPPGEKLSDIQYSSGDPHDRVPIPSSLLAFERDTGQADWDWSLTVTRTRTGSTGGPSTPVAASQPGLHRTIGGYTVSIDGSISKTHAQRVLDSITLARHPDRPDTSWFDLAQALP
jgi:hypothetical protein